MLLASNEALAENSASDLVKNIVDIVSGIVTVLAVIVGGVWAYFRFVKERTYRPRLGVNMTGTWVAVADRYLLIAEITVMNIGQSVINLRQRGTGLRVSKLTSLPTTVGPVQWEPIKVYEIYKDHEWIEPSETVSDQLLLMVDDDGRSPVLFEARLVWEWHGDDDHIVVLARQVVTPREPATSSDSPPPSDAL